MKLISSTRRATAAFGSRLRGCRPGSPQRDRDQLWARPSARYRKGERWYLTPQQEALAGLRQPRVAHDPWTSQVSEIVWERLKGPDVSPGEVMEHMSLPATGDTP